MKSEPPRVILIIGMARSGSTLLSMILGSLKSSINVGELMHLWDRGISLNHLCGCGERFSDCTFWQKIMANLANDDAKLNQEFQRNFLAAQHRHSIRKRKKEPAPEGYGEVVSGLKNMVSEIGLVTGSRFIIDSSKQRNYARLLAEAVGPQNVDVVHIVRDPRGVAYSASRNKLKTDAGPGAALMVRRSPRKTALAWFRMQLAAGVLKRSARSFQTLQYEELCKIGPAALVPLLGNIDSRLAEECVSLSQSGSVISYQTQHTVSGNPMRVGGSEITISLDERWHREMNVFDYLTVTAICAPFLLRYRYPLGRKSG